MCLQEQTPTAEDAEKRRGIMQALNDIVETDLPAYPGLCIKPYGSYVSGLYCPSGDLDLSIEGTSTGGCAADNLCIGRALMGQARCSFSRSTKQVVLQGAWE